MSEDVVSEINIYVYTFDIYVYVILLIFGHLIINTTIYNCALDNVMANTKMLVEGEIEKDFATTAEASSAGGELGDEDEGEFWLIKGNSPTRDDIFRYRVKLRKDVGVGDKIVFLNAGAYNYTTDFFGYKKLGTEILG